MKNFFHVLLLALIHCINGAIFTKEINYSAKADFAENPFLAYGYNPKTKVLSGYLAAFRVAPGKTDECKVIFTLVEKRLSVKYLEDTWVKGEASHSDSGVSLVMEKNEPILRFHKHAMGGDCDWILPFNVGERVSEVGDDVFVKMNVPNKGDWIGVYAVGAKRAMFHSEANSATVRKGYLVEGNIVYVYDEQPDWYYVRYDNGKRTTVGWIKKSDVVQP